MTLAPDDLLVAHAAATWALVGLTWVVQLVQYPGFALVGARELPAFHAAHCRRITLVVLPLMALELVTGLALLALPPPGAPEAALVAGVALSTVVWGTTALAAAPLHARLVGPHRDAVQRSLLAVSWARTAAWTARGGLVAGLAAAA